MNPNRSVPPMPRWSPADDTPADRRPRLYVLQGPWPMTVVDTRSDAPPLTVVTW